MAAVEGTEAPELGVYVHWPFCLAKCPYCDFNSHVRDAVDQDRWRRAYLTEIGAAADLCQGRRPATSVFIGGGTPSLMDPDTVEAVIDAIAGGIGLAADAEITMEANPTSAEAANFRDYHAAGVNRLSLGMQALDDRALAALGREHDAATAKAALAMATRTFGRVSFDLIYARPGQGVAEWRQELAQALAFGTGHLSLYQLTIEPGTPFAETHAGGGLAIPHDDAAAELYDATQELCQGAGLPAYEISNHARPGEACRHNLTYWRCGDWLGIGPGAHGRLTTPGGRLATTQIRAPEPWLGAVESSGTGAQTAKLLDGGAELEELVLMGLRLAEGLAEAVFRRATGRSFAAAFGPALADLEGLVEHNRGVLRATASGRLVLNQLVLRLVAAAETINAELL